MICFGMQLKDYLKNKKIDVDSFAEEIGIEVKKLNNILNGKESVNEELAKIIEHKTDIPAGYIMSIEKDYLNEKRLKEESIMPELYELWKELVKVRNIDLEFIRDLLINYRDKSEIKDLINYLKNNSGITKQQLIYKIIEDNSVKKDELIDIVIKSVDKLYENDYSLIRRKASERDCVFKFGIYFNKFFLERYKLMYNLSIDCEYNRNGNRKKSLKEFPNGIVPDFILHQRENNRNNLLVIEFKHFGSGNDYITKKENDINKIKGLTNAKENYKFDSGVFIELKREGYELYIIKNAIIVDEHYEDCRKFITNV